MMTDNEALFGLFVVLYAMWQLTRIAGGVQSIATELSALRAIAEKNRR